MVDPLGFARDVARQTVADLSDAAGTAFPTAIRVVVALVLSYVAIRIVTGLLRRLLDRAYPEREALVADLLLAVVSILLWFGVGLAVLSMLGLEAIAASLGTATGFVALGVSYALSDMIEDTVAGVYLLRDPDFEHGDRVAAADVTGTVESIELRKCRVRTDDGDVVVLANRNVEKRWTKLTGVGEPAASP